jgi:teichuronic acid biosynthesis glycosyltransferase TuaH
VLTPDQLIESINWLPDSGLYAALNQRNNRRLARAIQKGIAQLGLRNVILFNDNDICRSFYLKELLAPQLSVYYSRDYMLAVDYWRKHGEVLEPQLVAKSDVCVANSSYLAAYCRRYNPHSYDVGQGCDAALAPPPPAEKPAELRGLRGPLIGYVGALVASRLDVEVLAHLARQRPDWSLVLIGPEDAAFRASVLHQLPNVHFLGAKEPGRLAAYMQHFDVCLNPQLVNQMTIGNYPRKVDEYLALGRPVVATRTEAMRLFEEQVYLADSREDYVPLVAQALEQDSPARQQQRRAFAAQHTWQNSVGKIYEAILAVSALPEPGPLAPPSRPKLTAV